ncbi:hypothetical protein [uncultured Methylobacterium sp.]|uniref:hypothetical protein n=1 Tax=uncultured Methylobacterium sp. TaxID=157278 RepID=UPI0035CAD3A5
MTPAAPTCGCDEARGQAAIEQAVIRAFERSLDGQGLSVMAALEAAARAVGTLYGRIAAAHGPGSPCACGWVPDPDAELIVLEAHLAAALMRPRRFDLAGMEAAGRA